MVLVILLGVILVIQGKSCAAGKFLPTPISLDVGIGVRVDHLCFVSNVANIMVTGVAVERTYAGCQTSPLESLVVLCFSDDGCFLTSYTICGWEAVVILFVEVVIIGMNVRADHVEDECLLMWQVFLEVHT